jgi:hypothetical protein
VRLPSVGVGTSGKLRQLPSTAMESATASAGLPAAPQGLHCFNRHHSKANTNVSLSRTNLLPHEQRAQGPVYAMRLQDGCNLIGAGVFVQVGGVGTRRRPCITIICNTSLFNEMTETWATRRSRGG